MLYNGYVSQIEEEEAPSKTLLVISFLFVMGFCGFAIYMNYFPMREDIPMDGPILVVMWTMRVLAFMCIAVMVFLGRMIFKK